MTTHHVPAAVLFLGLAFLFTLPLAAQNEVPAQTPPLPGASLAELDRETGRLAELVTAFFSPRIHSSRDLPSISAGQGDGSELGRYWIAEICSRLTGTLAVLSPESGNPGEYRLETEIIILDQTIRVYTRIVERSGQISTSWTTDLALTEFTGSIADSARSRNNRSRPVPRDSFEPDSREHPVLLIPGAPPVRRTLHEKDEDWFVIVPEENGLLTMETSGELDTEMALYNEENDLLAEDDDSGENSNARINFGVEAGKQYLVKISAYSEETGYYGFRTYFRIFPDKAMEPNDTLETAYPIELGTLEAYLYENDRDWYRITLSSNGYFTVYTEGTVDTLLILHDTKGRELAVDDDSGSETNAKISLSLTAGTYFIEVRSYDEETGAYTLVTRMEEAVAADAYEIDDDRSLAKPIIPGENQIRTFTTADDVDWAVFTVERAGTYSISARGETNDDADTYLGLYNAAGNLTAEDDDSGPGYSALIRRRLEPGVWYIRVHALEPIRERYILRVNRE